MTAVISGIILCLILAGGGYFYWLHKHPKQFTRDRFAFAGLAVLSALTLALIHTVSGPTPWEFAFAGLKGITTGKFDLPHSSGEGSVLALLCIVIVAYTIIKLHQVWPGQVTEEQWKARQLNQQPNLVLEGINELKRLVTRSPEPKLHSPTGSRDFAKIDSKKANVQFNIAAKELFCESHPDINFEKDPTISWHDRGSFWLGNDRRTKRSVILFCTGSNYSLSELQGSVAYIRQVDVTTLSHVDFFQVRRRATDFKIEQIENHPVKSSTTDDLLETLIDIENSKIENYKETIYQRVATDTLPNSDLTIADTFTESQIVVEQLGNAPRDFSKFITEWASDGRPSHIALLGEYGQGKSTSVLMFVHLALQRKIQCSRLPILIELRGKSPKNQSPLEMLGAWGAIYGISGSALLALLRAGRLLIIFDGFDEMDGLDDERLRYDNFASLWEFAAFDNSKILITGRPELFLDDVELRRDLAVHPDIATGPFTTVARLQRFNESQICDALRNLPEETKDEIIGLALTDSSFMDIVSRPSLIQPVAAIWKDTALAGSKRGIKSALIIQLFLESTYRRQADKMREERSHRFMRLNQSELSFFTRAAAVYIVAERLSGQITSAQLLASVQKVWQAIGDSVCFEARPEFGEDPAPLKKRLKDVSDPVELISTHIRSYGIIVRDYSRSDTFKYSHKSYLELLVGKTAADIILGSELDEHALIMNCLTPTTNELLISPVAVSFCGESMGLLIKEGDNVALLNKIYDFIARTGMQYFMPRPLHKLFFIHLPTITVARRIAKVVRSPRRGENWYEDDRLRLIRRINMTSSYLLMSSMVLFVPLVFVTLRVPYLFEFDISSPVLEVLGIFRLLPVVAFTAVIVWLQFSLARFSKHNVFEDLGNTLITLSKDAVGKRLTKKYYGRRFLRVLHLMSRVSSAN
jgi:hypothetical protein